MRVRGVEHEDEDEVVIAIKTLKAWHALHSATLLLLLLSYLFVAPDGSTT